MAVEVRVDPTEPASIKDYIKTLDINLLPDEALPFDYLIKTPRVIIGIERKTNKDFVSSIIDGRINQQLYSLSASTHYGILAIIGNVTSALMDTRFRRKSYIAFLVSSIIKTAHDGYDTRISLVNLDTEEDFKLFLEEIINLSQGNLVRLPTVSTRKSDVRGAAIAFLSTIPGVGEVTANKLLKNYACIKDIVNSDLETIVDAVGSYDKAQKIYNFFNMYF